MSDLLFLVFAYLRHHAIRSGVLVLCLALALALPWTMHTVLQQFATALTARAEATPLVVGLRGSPFDLALHVLTFRNAAPGRLVQGDANRVAASGENRVIPLFSAHRARGFPIVGTELSYFPFRGLRAAEGTLPLRLGDGVAGSAVARQLGLAPGDTILSDPANPFVLGGQQPLEIRITGVLAPTGTADDEAIFTSLATAWVVEGLGHGHEEEPAAPDTLLAADDRSATLSAAVETFQRITPENIGSFHFHGDPATFPLTALIVLPADERAATLLRGAYRHDERLQAIRPSEVTREFLAGFLRMERFLLLQQGVTWLIAASLVVLVGLLAFRLRRGEFDTFVCLGGSRATIRALQVLEWAALLILATLLAYLLHRAGLPVLQQWVESWAAGHGAPPAPPAA
jgi:putative ABC transport system permease protein